jgi:GTPase SAR1 family protein
VPDAAEYYRTLDRGRLVVLGDAGAGKTILLIQLALDLLGRQSAGDAGSRPGPVRMNLASFDPCPGGQRPDEVGLTQLSEQFESWLVTQLRRRGIGRQSSVGLVVSCRLPGRCTWQTTCCSHRAMELRRHLS